VRLIASAVVSCDAENRVDEVLSRKDWQDFSHIPVRRDGRICGVLDRRDASLDAEAGQQMRPLDDSLLISASTPIDTFIHALDDTDYRLVVDRGGVIAIVTRSDLQKLPVRSLAFTVITHMEMVMGDLIRKMCPDDWLNRGLDDRDRANIEGWYRRAKQEDIGIDRLAVASLAHKGTVITSLRVMPAEFGASIDEIVKLRNDLAHANTFLEDEPALNMFVARYKSACRWVDEIRKRLNEEEIDRSSAATGSNQ
jgi:hypothetical protein